MFLENVAHYAIMNVETVRLSYEHWMHGVQLGRDCSSEHCGWIHEERSVVTDWSTISMDLLTGFLFFWPDKCNQIGLKLLEKGQNQNHRR